MSTMRKNRTSRPAGNYFSTANNALRRPPQKPNCDTTIHDGHDRIGTAVHRTLARDKFGGGSPSGWVGLFSGTRRKNSIRHGLFQTSLGRIIVILCGRGTLDADRQSAFHDICISFTNIIAPSARSHPSPPLPTTPPPTGRLTGISVMLFRGRKDAKIRYHRFSYR